MKTILRLLCVFLLLGLYSCNKEDNELLEISSKNEFEHPFSIGFDGIDCKLSSSKVKSNTIEYENIAIGKPVIASDAIGSYYKKENVIDKNENTMWVAYQCNKPDNQYKVADYIIIDLEQETEINSIKLVWGEGYEAEEFAVYLSNDNENWTLVKDFINNLELKNELYGVAKARYVGIHCIKKKFKYFGLAEFEILQKVVSNTATINLSIESEEEVCLILKATEGATLSIEWGDNNPGEEFVFTSLPVTKQRLLKAGDYSIRLNGDLDLVNYFYLDNNYKKNHITDIQLDQMTGLEVFRIPERGLQSLDVNNLKKLKTLELSNNKLSDIDLSKLNMLEELLLDKNSLTAIDLSYHPNLRKIDLSHNNLGAINFSNNSLLEEVSVQECSLSTIELSNLKELIKLKIPFNKISSIDLSHNSKIEVLLANENILTELDVSHLLNLKQLLVPGNVLTSLRLGVHPKLNSLTCSNNKIEVLNLSECPSLAWVYINQNYLKELNIENCNNIFILSAFLNEISSLKLPEQLSFNGVRIDVSSNMLNLQQVNDAIRVFYNWAMGNKDAEMQFSLYRNIAPTGEALNHINELRKLPNCHISTD